MGSSKYPKEDEYSEFLSKHSGGSNAQTDSDHTNQFFTVENNQFQGALDRFSRFFIDPLFLKDAVQREMQQVDSEHTKNLQNDTWRLMGLFKFFVNPEHPFSRFNTGNKETLDKPNIRETLMQLCEEYYASELMKVVLVANQSVEELRSMATEMFGPIVNKQEKPYDISSIKPFLTDSLAKTIQIAPVEDKKSVFINFVTS